MRRGDGLAAVGKLGVILGSVVLAGAACAIVAAVLPDGPVTGSETVVFLQSSLYMGAAAVLSLIVGAARMAWEQRAEPGRDPSR